MTRIQRLDPGQITGHSKALLDDLQRDLGFVPTLMRLLSHSPAALAGYLALRASLHDGVLPRSLRERIAIAVAATNKCDECLVNHSQFGRQVGLSDDDIYEAAQSRSADPVAAAALSFARALMTRRGHVDDRALTALRAAGFTEAAIVEIIAAVAVNLFANFVNNVAAVVTDS